jgi:hypothetical protein
MNATLLVCRHCQIQKRHDIFLDSRLMSYTVRGLNFYFWEHAVEYMVEALWYKPEGCGLGPNEFAEFLFFHPYHGPGFYVASNKVEYAKIFLGIKRHLWASTSHDPVGLRGLLEDSFTYVHCLSLPVSPYCYSPTSPFFILLLVRFLCFYFGYSTIYRITLAVNAVEFVSDRMANAVLRGRWWYTIVLNVNAPTEDKIDDVTDNFYATNWDVCSIISANTIWNFC